MRQKNFSINLSGRSRLELETYISDFDSLYVRQQDSSQVKFEMAEDLPGSQVMRAKVLQANVQGFSLLDVGHFAFKSIHQVIGDSAAIILSGNTLKTMQGEDENAVK